MTTERAGILPYAADDTSGGSSPRHREPRSPGADGVFDQVPRDAKPWLLGVARRVLANQRRAAGRREALRARVAAEREIDPEPGRRPPVIEALTDLSTSDREILLLVAWDGLSTRETALVLGCSAAAAKVRLHRARRRLRAELEALEPDKAPRRTTTRRLEETP